MEDSVEDTAWFGSLMTDKTMWRVHSTNNNVVSSKPPSPPRTENCLPTPLMSSDIPQNNDPSFRRMDIFPPSSINDFKHVLYNLLVENHNNPLTCSFLQPFSCVDEKTGKSKDGFRFNSMENPDKKLPELYAHHIKKARLDWEDSSSVFIQDLYRYYMRACVELMSKYFEKKDKYSYLYDEVPLFVPNESLEEAETRLKGMKSRARMRRKKRGADDKDDL